MPKLTESISAKILSLQKQVAEVKEMVVNSERCYRRAMASSAVLFLMGAVGSYYLSFFYSEPSTMRVFSLGVSAFAAAVGIVKGWQVHKLQTAFRRDVEAELEKILRKKQSRPGNTQSSILIRLRLPKNWALLSFLMSGKVRRELFEPSHQELLADHAKAQKFRTCGAQRWIAFCFLFRTVILVINCWLAAGGDRLARIIVEPVLNLFRRS